MAGPWNAVQTPGRSIVLFATIIGVVSLWPMFSGNGFVVPGEGMRLRAAAEKVDPALTFVPYKGFSREKSKE